MENTKHLNGYIEEKKTTRFTRLVVFAANKHCPTRRI